MGLPHSYCLPNEYLMFPSCIELLLCDGGDRRCCHPVASPSDYPGSAEHNEWGSSPAQISLVSVGGGEL